MSSKIAEQYHDELTTWQEAMELHRDEIADLEEKLESILALNTIPERAMKAEQLLNQLELQRVEIDSLTEAVDQQEITLKGGKAPLEDSEITSQVTTGQELLRQHIQMMEIEFAAARKEVHGFFKQDWGAGDRA